MNKILRFSLMLIMALVSNFSFADTVNLIETDFTAGQGDWTIDNKTLPEGLSYVWKADKSYGMKASAYVSGKTYAAESWLISPVIDATNYTGLKLSFKHAINKFTSVDKAKEEATVWVKADGADWEKVEISYPTKLSWTFLDVKDIDLSKYDGKKLQVAFKYVSTAEKAGTWEVNNVVVSGEGAPLVDPNAKGQEANPYTVEELLAMDADNITVTDNVWVKGIIVGYLNSDNKQTVVKTDTEGNTNIAIAATAGETDASKVVPVQLPKGDIRTALNVADHQDYIGKEVMVKGNIQKYFSVIGVKNTSDYKAPTATNINTISIKANPDAPLYNLAGQRVSKSYKGVVIKSGKKVVVK